MLVFSHPPTKVKNVLSLLSMARSDLLAMAINACILGSLGQIFVKVNSCCWQRCDYGAAHSADVVGYISLKLIQQAVTEKQRNIRG